MYTGKELCRGNFKGTGQIWKKLGGKVDHGPWNYSLTLWASLPQGGVAMCVCIFQMHPHNNMNPRDGLGYGSRHQFPPVHTNWPTGTGPVTTTLPKVDGAQYKQGCNSWSELGRGLHSPELFLISSVALQLHRYF